MTKLIEPDEDAAQASHRTLSRLIELADDEEADVMKTIRSWLSAFGILVGQERGRGAA